MVKRKVTDADFEEEAQGNQLFVEEFCTKPCWDEDGVQSTAGIGLDGKEYGDPVPMSPPVGFENPPDLMEMMRSMIRTEQFRQKAEAEGFDTDEEAQDFDIDEDPMPLTFHEAILQAPPVPSSAQPSPSVPAASPQVETAKQGGEEAGSPQTPAPAAPSGPPQSVRAT